MAVDEHYAAPLFITILSLLENLRAAVGLELYLMSIGLTRETRRKLDRAWGDRVRIHWVASDYEKVESLRSYGYMSSPAANLRLLVGSSLPDDVSKVIYLDADLLIQKDIFEIWERDMQGKIVLAVQDSYIQRFPARCRSPQKKANTQLPYFNSGVMVIDLKAWRAEGLEERCLAVAERLKHRTKWLDQDVLNTCLAGRWGLLPPVWNKQFFVGLFPDWQCSPYEEAEFQEARSHPAIIHFCTRTKPWHCFSDHPREEVLAYQAVLRRTPFSTGFVSTQSAFRRVVELLAAPHRSLLDTIAAACRARRRTHAMRAMLPDAVKLALLHPWTVVTVPLAVVRERAAIRLGKVSR